ncbi:MULTISPECIES: helix-turn-helix domain-containing protein [unclassified Streptomyces]|uniref:helix-turn-helix transcriptional regulator n=1 Tax=unclassified Streptomyces TaxID=2593676 RepID=UPI001F5B2C4E|nr:MULTISPECIES: helix-turn-helix domain-containing protein [unclassified Streptomyces]
MGGDQALAVYQELRIHPDATFDEVADRFELSAEERERCRDELAALGLTEAGGPAGSGASPAPAIVDPDVALLRLLRRERDRLQERLAATSRTHTALEALAGPFLQAGATPRAEVEVEIVDAPDRVLGSLADLTDSVRTAAHFMHTGSVRREEMGGELDRDRLWAGRGVRVRAMYSRRAASVPEMAQHLEERAAVGVEIRLSSVVPMNMVLADENFAMLPTDPYEPSSPSILARGPGLVRSYLALYEYCWTAAAPYGQEEPAERGGDGLSEQQRTALLMLASGIKDEQIARNLGVSLRTVSRLLSEVMQELGAASRFEAGVKAARLGLLDSEGTDRGL